MIRALLMLAALFTVPPAAGQGRSPDVIYVATPPEVVEAILRIAGVKQGDVLYDLGSGDGRIPIAAAKKFGIRATGIDIDAERIWEATQNARAAGVAALVEFRREDLFTADFRDATVVTLYLHPDLNVKLRPRLWAELRPGTRIVSHQFGMGDWVPEKTLELNGRTIYFWTVPNPREEKLMAKPLLIEVASDVVCPWCYIGKRRMEKALQSLAGEVEVRVEWLPFQLNPDMPEGGIARADYRRAKFGSVEKGRMLDARVAQEGAGEGIAFAFDRMQRTPNTIAAHQLIDLAQKQGKGNAVVDALFRAYFEEAKDIGDEAVLKEIAERAGVTGRVDKKILEEVKEKEERVRELGISGVPTFIFNKESGLSGAYPPEQLAQAIREAVK